MEVVVLFCVFCVLPLFLKVRSEETSEGLHEQLNFTENIRSEETPGGVHEELNFTENVRLEETSEGVHWDLNFTENDYSEATSEGVHGELKGFMENVPSKEGVHGELKDLMGNVHSETTSEGAHEKLKYIVENVDSEDTSEGVRGESKDFMEKMRIKQLKLHNLSKKINSVQEEFLDGPELACIASTKIDHNMVIKAKITHTVPADIEVYKEFLSCCWQEYGYQDLNGTIQWDKIAEVLELEYPLGTVYKLIAKCEDIEGSTPGDAVALVMQCLDVNAPNLNDVNH